jgi:hypothetical protein
MKVSADFWEERLALSEETLVLGAQIFAFPTLPFTLNM